MLLVVRAQPLNWPVPAQVKDLSGQKAPAGFSCTQKTKYMTLGPKFYTKLVLPPKCYFCFVNPWLRCGSAALYLYIPVLVSKHDLKHFSKSAIFGFAGGVLWIWNDVLLTLKCCLRICKCLVYDFEMFLMIVESCLMILKCGFNDLSTSLNNLWERRPTKGGAAAFGRRPPFVGVSLKILLTAAKIIQHTFQNH